jgi:DNA-binding PadR family transcriptional regulator
VLEFAILGLLREQPRHGYELRRTLADLGFWSVSFGSLYPAIKRLEKAGLIAVKSQSGRRKSYQITSDGEDHFVELLSDEATADDERSFNLRLAFLRYVDPDNRIDVLERRRAHLVERLAEARDALKRGAERTKERMDRYTLALMEHGVASAEADIAWLDELIETEKAQSPRRAERRRRKATRRRT